MLAIFKILLINFIICNVESAARIPIDFKLRQAEPCTTAKCRPPNCRCSGLTLPREEFKGREKEIPQFVTVTFDDNVNSLNYAQYQELLTDLVSPDGCDARATFYVSHEYSDYAILNALYSQGHEVALHSITHNTGGGYWSNADVNRHLLEFGNEIDILEKFAKINRKDIRGMRLPFLQLSGDNSFLAAKHLGLLYDSSWPTDKYRNPAMWPYTLDYLSVQDCPIGPCPTASIPGLWVSPMVSWLDKKGYSCSMLDACYFLPEDNVDSVFEWMKENFLRHYDNNRAPFGMYLHAAWFSRSPNYIKGFRKFLEYANILPDVYITTPTSVIEYMKNPTLGKPFKGCVKKPKTSCRPVTCTPRKQSTGEVRYMIVCDRCPAVYPWLDNPLGEL